MGKAELLRVRVAAADRELLAVAARLEGTTMSEFTRRAVTARALDLLASSDEGNV